MTDPILSQPPDSFRSRNQGNGNQPIDLGAGFTFTKIEGGYEVFDDENVYTITKPNGKIVCDCPEFKLAPPGTCDHIAELLERFHNGNHSGNGPALPRSCSSRRSITTPGCSPSSCRSALPPVARCRGITTSPTRRHKTWLRWSPAS